MSNTMKKLTALLLLLVTMLLTACDVVHHQGQLPGTGDEGQEEQNPGGTEEDDGEFSVYVRRFDYIYKEYVPFIDLDDPDYTPAEPITVQWTNGYEYYTATLGEDSRASVSGLDGDYNVTLHGLDKSFAYNSNAYVATNYAKEVVIDVYEARVVKTTGGNGSNLYDKCIVLKDLAVYSAPVKDAGSVIYMQFTPTVSGTYSIESWVDVTASEYNPYIDIYEGSVAYKRLAYTMDDGGISSGYTQNFKYTVYISDEQIQRSAEGKYEGGAVFTFAVRCSSKNDIYPMNVNFAITLDGGFTGQNYQKLLMTPDDELADTYDYLRKVGGMDYADFTEFVYEKTGYNEYSYGGHFASDLLPKMYSLIRETKFPVWNDLAKCFEVDGVIANHEVLYSFKELRSSYSSANTYESSYNSLSGADRDKLNENYAKGLIYYLVKCRFNESGILTFADSAYTINVSGTDRRVFDGSKYKYFDKTEDINGDGVGDGDGFYHYYDAEVYADNGGYGPILYAAISTPTRYTGASFTTIEVAGNAALTVNRIYNYKLYMEGFKTLSYYDLTIDHSQDTTGPYLCTATCYCRLSGKCDGACALGCDRCDADCRNLDSNGFYALGLSELANADGYYPVTRELQSFLQNFCISQRYFADGNGWVETNEQYPVYALEDDQWLFACAYYLPR